MKESFILHTDVWPAVKQLTLEQRGALFSALICYQLGEPRPKMDIQTEMAFLFMSAQMDRDNEKYEQVSAKRRDAANARWSKQKMQVHDLHYDTDTVTDTDTDNESDTDAPVALPPLSPRDEASLRDVAGDRADTLIEDVRTYYLTHPEKTFPGWPLALAQFDRNQRRWGRANEPKNIDEIMAMAFKGVD